jgi:hypothetical protein
MSSTHDASVTSLCQFCGGSSGGWHATLVETDVKDKVVSANRAMTCFASVDSSDD